ncbi:hypothetical protein QBC46DRAFT_356936 [Diplogelasinospora grovesii]|uniref:Uncharacterized protein n=1 Tax=Diplogelasinospora grovesii TaxID=303347 RepID=A0AAN6N0V5_9PEZI|nr:hypothetical protein QBC46DRAFT_356936 [Diplogelasinospora grovesii]
MVHARFSTLTGMRTWPLDIRQWLKDITQPEPDLNTADLAKTPPPLGDEYRPSSQLEDGRRPRTPHANSRLYAEKEKKRQRSPSEPAPTRPREHEQTRYRFEKRPRHKTREDRYQVNRAKVTDRKNKSRNRPSGEEANRHGRTEEDQNTRSDAHARRNLKIIEDDDSNDSSSASQQAHLKKASGSSSYRQAENVSKSKKRRARDLSPFPEERIIDSPRKGTQEHRSPPRVSISSEQYSAFNGTPSFSGSIGSESDSIFEARDMEKYRPAQVGNHERRNVEREKNRHRTNSPDDTINRQVTQQRQSTRHSNRTGARYADAGAQTGFGVREPLGHQAPPIAAYHPIREVADMQEYASPSSRVWRPAYEGLADTWEDGGPPYHAPGFVTGTQTRFPIQAQTRYPPQLAVNYVAEPTHPAPVDRAVLLSNRTGFEMDSGWQERDDNRHLQAPPRYVAGLNGIYNAQGPHIYTREPVAETMVEHFPKTEREACEMSNCPPEPEGMHLNAEHSMAMNRWGNGPPQAPTSFSGEDMPIAQRGQRAIGSAELEPVAALARAQISMDIVPDSADPAEPASLGECPVEAEREMLLKLWRRPNIY